MKILVTGGAGFVGSNFVHYILRKHADWRIVNLDKLTYAGNLANLKDLENEPRHTFIKGDVADSRAVNKILAAKDFDLIVNFAAETHVDRSFIDPGLFLRTNALGTQVLLEGARKYGVKKFIHISTPEVYGGTSPLKPGEKFTEDSPFLPNNPYSASKAAADMVCRAYHQTYGMYIMYTRFANAYGPFQYTEKLLSLAATHALDDKSIPLYGDGQYRRNWIYIDDICRAIDLIIQKGKSGQAYNIGSGYEMSNIDLVGRILAILHKPESLITFVPDRPSHDWQYPLDSTRIMTELGWKMEWTFEKGLSTTVNWYKNNREWWKNLKVLDYGKAYKEIAQAKGKTK